MIMVADYIRTMAQFELNWLMWITATVECLRLNQQAEGVATRREYRLQIAIPAVLKCQLSVRNDTGLSSQD